MRSDRALAHLEDVWTNCDRARRAYEADRTAVGDPESVGRAAVERHPITVGEALVRLRQDAPEVLARPPEAPAAIAMRNVLVHLYHRVNPGKLERAVQVSVPRLSAQARAVAGDLERDPAYLPP